MQNNILRKGLVFGIILLFVGASVIPTTGIKYRDSTRSEDTSGNIYVLNVNPGYVARSKDQGVTWEQIGTVGVGAGYVYSITSDINGSLYTIHYNNGSVYRSIDGGFTWQHVGVAMGNCICITSDLNGNLYTIRANNGLVYRSIDHGVTWQHIGYVPDHSYCITSDLNGYLYTIRMDDGRVYRSTNGGINWYQVYNLPSQGFYGITSDINGFLYTMMYDYNVVYRSIDQGTSWQVISNSGMVGCIDITSDLKGYLYTLRENGRVWRSIDGGFTWQDMGYSSVGGCWGITSGIWPLIDNIPPKISNVTAQPDPQRIGGWVNISCNVTDGAFVDTVKVNITYPDDGSINVTMSGVSHIYGFYYNTTYTQLGTYNYFIWANDTNGYTNFSGNYTFEILSHQPHTPSNPDPQNGAINISADANLSWDSGDQDSNDTVYYDVYFGTALDPPFKERIGPYPAIQTTITYEPGTLNHSTQYYWKIIAEDNNGETSEGLIWNFTTEQYAPIANFTYTPANPTKDDVIQFTDTSIDPDGTIVSWWWDFGDYHYSDLQDPTYQYAEDGIYNVSLTVIDNNDSTDTIQKTIVVSTTNNPPTQPNIDGPTSGKAGEKYEYIFNATDPDGDDICYFVDWGDDTSSGWTEYVASGTEVKLKHTWSEQGTYTITAKAKDVFDDEGPEVKLTVTMPRNRAFNLNFNLLNWLFEQFPNIFPILRYILGL